MSARETPAHLLGNPLLEGLDFIQNLSTSAFAARLLSPDLFQLRTQLCTALARRSVLGGPFAGEDGADVVLRGSEERRREDEQMV